MNGILLNIKEDVPEQMKEDDRPSYDEWYDRCRNILLRARGIDLDDLADCPYRDWYDERVRPVYAINKALKRNGGNLDWF